MVAVVILAVIPLGTGAGADPAQSDAPAQTNFVPGSGRARASLFEIAPRTGGLAIPVNFGKALVTYQGLSATATSGGLKPPAQNSADGDCGKPQPPGGGGGGGGGDGGGAPAPPGGGGSGPPTSFPFVSTLTVSTGEKDAEKGHRMDQGSFPDGSPISGTFQHQEVSADGDPSGRAITTGGRLAFGPLVEVVQGRTEAEAGVVDGKARAAHAVTSIDRLSLLDGLVILGDLRWEATQRTGEGEGATGAFTVGSVLFQGKPLPAPPAPAALPGLAPPVLPDPLVVLNTALAPSGLVIEAPRFDPSGGVARVTPMSLRFVDSALGRVVLAPLVTSLQPLRDPVVGGLLAASCDFGAAVTVADVAAGILTGSGGITFDFGGVTATTEGEEYDNPFAGGVGDDAFGGGDDLTDSFPELGPVPATASSGPLTDVALPSTAADFGTPVEDSAGGPSGSRARPGTGGDTAGEEVAIDASTGLFGSTSRHEPGQKGGRALAVAALALLTVAALAAADAFHLRRASRSFS